MIPGDTLDNLCAAIGVLPANVVDITIRKSTNVPHMLHVQVELLMHRNEFTLVPEVAETLEH